MKLVTGNKLNRLWNNGVVAKMVAKTKVLNTMEEIEANTNVENIAGALALKEVNDKLVFPDGSEFYLDIKNGRRGFNSDPARGAGTFSPFSKTPTIKSYNCSNIGSGKSTTTIEKGRILNKDAFLLAAGQTNEGVVSNSIASSTKFGMWANGYNSATGSITINTGMSSIYYSKIHMLYLD